jgi:hypothetical protein
MADPQDRIRSDETAFQQLLETVPGFDGYREREIRRAADKLVREHLVAELDRVRDTVRATTAERARAADLDGLGELDRLERRLGKVRDNLRFADYGYTGFFDAVKIREEQLDALYEYDLSLRGQIAKCAEATSTLAGAQGPEHLRGLLKQAEAAVGELQTMVDRRGEVAAGLVLD